MLLDIILVEPELIRQAGFEFTINHLIIHIIAETVATIIVEGIIFAIFCKEIKFRKVAFANAITCIALHIVYYYFARNIFSQGYFPPNPNFELMIRLLLTGHIQVVVALEIIVLFVEYLFYISGNKNRVKQLETIDGSNVKVETEVFGSSDNSKPLDKKKIFIVTLFSNLVAFFVGIVISVGITMWIIQH